MRMRSMATPIAVVAFIAAAFFWIPDPKSNNTSLSWQLPDGRVQSPLYSAEYVGFAISVLSGIFLTLGAFYLVAGSVRRDRERGVGAILAATPLSKAAYLGGKFAAHCVYLLVLAVLGLAAGLVAFVRFGAGPFSLFDFTVPYFLATIPAIAIVASFAVFFDVTPGLRSRGGLVLWFFVFIFVLIKLPLDLSGQDVDDSSAETRPGRTRPVFDPAGLATHQWRVRQSLPDGIRGISTGYVMHGKPFERVPWKGAPVTADLVAMRALNLLLALAPLGLAILVFDRFDPSRGRFRRRSRKPKIGVSPEVFGFAEVSTKSGLTPVNPRPRAAGAIVAEARLIWESASWIKWPLALAAILAGLLPGNMAQGIFLALLIPVVSEAAAREEMAGTRALVFSQPAVPRSLALWKTASIGLVVLMLGMPMTVHGLLESPVKGLACVVGLAALAALCAALGSLSSGGKLFTGLAIAFWYAAMSGAPHADMTGALGKSPAVGLSLVYLGAGALLVAAAVGREKLRLARS
jgi:hypothetical protein